MKTIECQEMTEALKLEQNLNNKLYDDVSNRHRLRIIIMFIFSIDISFASGTW